MVNNKQKIYSIQIIFYKKNKLIIIYFLIFKVIIFINNFKILKKIIANNRIDN